MYSWRGRWEDIVERICVILKVILKGEDMAGLSTDKKGNMSWEGWK